MTFGTSHSVRCIPPNEKREMDDMKFSCRTHRQLFISSMHVTPVKSFVRKKDYLLNCK